MTVWKKTANFFVFILKLLIYLICFKFEMWILGAGTTLDGISYSFEHKNSLHSYNAKRRRKHKPNFMWKKHIFHFVAEWKLKAIENRLNHLFTCLANQIKFHIAIQSYHLGITMPHAPCSMSTEHKTQKYSNEFLCSSFFKQKKYKKNVWKLFVRWNCRKLFNMHINE